MQLKAKAKAKAKTVKEMAAGWKKTRDEPVPDDHAEGEDEEPKEEDATVCWWWASKLPQGKEMCQNDQKWPGARRSSAALWRRGLQEFSWTPEGECVCSWKYPVFEVFKKNSEICNKSQITGLA